MSIESEIKDLREKIKIREMGNDSYYLSLQYKEDRSEMYRLTVLLRNKNAKLFGSS